MKKLLVLWTFLLLALSANNLRAQIHIAPTAIYLNNQHSTGRIEVMNTSGKPVNVTVDVGYGYPLSDYDGQLYMKMFDQIPADAPSAADWIRIYPYRFTLPAGLRQTVRFAIFAPDSIKPGEYWARPIISSRTIQDRHSSNIDRVQAKLNIVQRTILALNYRHKYAFTRPVLDSVRVQQRNNKLRINSYIRRTGTAASLGNLNIRLVDTKGYKWFDKTYQVAVYHQLNRVIHLPAEELPSGLYDVQVELNSNRKGNRSGDILPFMPVQRTKSIKL